MEKWYRWLIIITFLCQYPAIQAQWDNPTVHYWTVREHYNPSFAGATESISTTALYRRGQVKSGNTTQQLIFSAGMPFQWGDKRHGVGVGVYTESIGILRNSAYTAQYNFQQKWKGGQFNIGLQAGLYDIDFDANSKHTPNITPVDHQMLDLTAGLSWIGKSAFAGISVMHINQPRFYIPSDTLSVNLSTDSIRSSIPCSYNFMMGYNISLFYPLEIEPMMWLQTDLSTIALQTTLRLTYKKRFSGGVSWRNKNGYAFFMGTQIQGVELGYAYEQHTSKANQNNKASHEVYLKYNFPLNYFKTKRQPHKSIRLL